MAKRMMCIFLSLVTCWTLCVPIFASEPVLTDSTANPMLLTTEDDMPKIPTARAITSSATSDSSFSTLETAARSTWASNTKEVLEDAYAQKVTDITEDADFITFTFDAPTEISPDTGYIDHVEYLKPESELATSTYSKKITYMYGWADGYYSLEKKEGTWSAIKDLFLTVAGCAGETMSIATFALSILGIAADFFSPTDPIRAENTAQYYLMNKIGQIKDPNTGIWCMYVYVGSRRSFYRTLLQKKGSYDHYVTVGFEETIPDSESNPSNYDDIEYKAHYLDNSWILDEVENIYLYGTRAYMSVFGMPKYFSETIPPK